MGYIKASEWTESKQESFLRYLQTYTAIAAAIQKKYNPWANPWDYIDLTAGTGFIQNGDHLIDGSALIALKTFRTQQSFTVKCSFIERDPSHYYLLVKALDAEKSHWSGREKVSYTVFREDHRNMLVNSIGRNRSMGLIYWDGLGEDVYPAKELAIFLNHNRRHDLLIMGSGTAPKRAGRTRLPRMLLTMPRNELWLSEPYTKWQWIFAFLTTWGELPNKISKSSITLHRWDSKTGKKILRILASTTEDFERSGQLNLFSSYRNYDEYLAHPRYRAIRKVALELANGICERCGKPATEVHHLRYPPWGEFDMVENLMAVCHQCHCWIEGKES
jgi:hypothetical protein